MTKYIFIFTLFLSFNLFGQTNEFQAKSQLYEDIAFLADDLLEGRMVGTQGEIIAAGYLAYRFKKLGLSPLEGQASYLQEFTTRKRANPHSAENSPEDKIIKGYNVVGMIDNGSTNTIVIGAHFDHLGYGKDGGSLYVGEKAIHNGADDNASGTAALLFLAEELMQKKYKNNFVFIAFSGEEQGLWGSNYFTKNPLLDLEKVNFMVNMDMVGRLNEERKLSVNGTGTSPLWSELLDKANDLELGLVKSESGIGPSDHTSFYKKDIPVLHFFTGQHRDYHKPSDDLELVNIDGLYDVGSYILNIIEMTDDKGKIEFTKTKEEENTNPRFTVSLGVMPDYLYDGKGMRVDAVTEGKPAFKADIKEGDIVVKLGNVDVVDMMAYMKALSEFKAGDKTTVEVKRGDIILVKEVTF